MLGNITVSFDSLSLSLSHLTHTHTHTHTHTGTHQHQRASKTMFTGYIEAHHVVCGGKLFWHDPHDNVATMAAKSSKTLTSLVSESSMSGDLTVQMLSEENDTKKEIMDEDEEDIKRATELREAFYRNVAFMSGDSTISNSSSDNTVIGQYTNNTNSTIDFTIRSRGHSGEDVVKTGHLKYIDLRGCDVENMNNDGTKDILITGLKDDEKRM